MDYVNMCEIVESKDNDGLVAILADVLTWPVSSTGVGYAIQVECLDHYRKIQAKDHDVLRDQARKFLKRTCAIAHPELASKW